MFDAETKTKYFSPDSKPPRGLSDVYTILSPVMNLTLDENLIVLYVFLTTLRSSRLLSEPSGSEDSMISSLISYFGSDNDATYASSDVSDV